MLITTVMSSHCPLKDLFIIQTGAPETQRYLSGAMCENLSQGQRNANGVNAVNKAADR